MHDTKATCSWILGKGRRYIVLIIPHPDPGVLPSFVFQTAQHDRSGISLLWVVPRRLHLYVCKGRITDQSHLQTYSQPSQCLPVHDLDRGRGQFRLCSYHIPLPQWHHPWKVSTLSPPLVASLAYHVQQPGLSPRYRHPMVDPDATTPSDHRQPSVLDHDESTPSETPEVGACSLHSVCQWRCLLHLHGCTPRHCYTFAKAYEYDIREV